MNKQLYFDEQHALAEEIVIRMMRSYLEDKPLMLRQIWLEVVEHIRSDRAPELHLYVTTGLAMLAGEALLETHGHDRDAATGRVTGSSATPSATACRPGSHCSCGCRRSGAT